MVEPYNTFISFLIYFVYLGIKCINKFANIGTGRLYIVPIITFSVLFLISM